MSDVKKEFDIEAVRKRCEAATEGPWEDGPTTVWAKDGGCVASEVYRYGDSEFIAHARTDLPAALDEIERLRAEAEPDETYADVVRERDEARRERDALLRAVDCTHRDYSRALDQTHEQRIRADDAEAALAETRAKALEEVAEMFERDFKCTSHTRDEALARGLVCAEPLKRAARVRALAHTPEEKPE